MSSFLAFFLGLRFFFPCPSLWSSSAEALGYSSCGAQALPSVSAMVCAGWVIWAVPAAVTKFAIL